MIGANRGGDEEDRVWTSEFEDYTTIDGMENPTGHILGYSTWILGIDGATQAQMSQAFSLTLTGLALQ